MPSKELTNEIATFLRNISVSSDNGGSFAEYECKEKAEELLSTILSALQEPTPAMHLVVSANWGRRTWAEYQQVLAVSALGEQSE
ncbi:hypothetical protein HGK82_22375 [Ochrobactrum sp. MT180101]|nr:hypothetical protein HGK82_22375 [Ochrobactrum sp. MT180101]